ncbi:glycosyltransferase [Spirosoma sp. BT702]|uniref:Glycosyltransferase n=1 Tax=Spirosoma profusum TaxID=2771354 RepID=A0A927AQ49_9BACT|nr:glycosyltransferase [Spirosoma profusum]MBD2699626.1 glycosyltransferase [Spirosoma profusum]
MKKIRVLHISTAHQPQDPRIVFKQCQTLADEYEVFCALPNADPSVAPDIHFIRLPYYRRVIWRILITCPLILLRCLPLRPKLVHIYVPEFVPFAYAFRLLGAQIIYEVQENLHKKMHLKTINKGRFLQKAFLWFDHLARQNFYLIFTEHGYLSTYSQLAKPHVVIYNFPLLSFLEPFRRPYGPNPTHPSFFYIGWLSFERAIDTLIKGAALLKVSHPNVAVHLFGQCIFTAELLEAIPDYAAVRDSIHFYGYTDQRLAFPKSAGATAGLALLKPVGDYPESYPTKLFEYMALGLPVVTSDFPLYQDVVERHRCGFCISPYEPQQLADALTYLIEHPDEAQNMGERGQRAVEEHYNWRTEAEKLLLFYKRILYRN